MNFEVIKKPLKIFKNTFKKRIIYNYFYRSYQSTALLSYITHPFRSQSLSHTNYFEAMSIAKVLDELGYKVDIIDYDSVNNNLDLSQYQIIIGFGDIFQRYFDENNKQAKTIYYGTGMHVCFQNTATMKRLKDVFDKKGQWITQSTRYVEKTWSYQTSLVDGMIVLGNEVCVDSYRRHYKGDIFHVLAPYYLTQNAMQIFERRTVLANKHFLWFGSAGLIHKGLDLLLDFFRNNPDLTLHICGNIFNETKFVECYKDELTKYRNIIVHGFVDISSPKFKEILQQCSFAIFPSCSEGGSPSVVTVIGNGALIPIISKETTVATAGNEVVIEQLNYDGIRQAVDKVVNMDEVTIKELQLKNYEYVKSYHNQDAYYKNLKQSIKKILEK